MERVIIIGCGGSGKSTLARKLGEITGLPVVHLDKIFWEPGNWEHLSREEFDIRLSGELEKPCWIMDGNFNRTIEMRLEKCDAVIYLDMSRLTCIFSWMGRVIKNWGKAREDMAPGCNEWFDPEFARWIWRFNSENRARYYALLKHVEGKQVFILKNRLQVKRFLRNVSKNTS